MRNILVIGAGRSSSTLIQYLLQHATEEDWKVTVGDLSIELAQKKTDNHPRGQAVFFDAFVDEIRREEIQKADLVISMLPPHMHLVVARECVMLKKHMVNASYLSPEIKQLHDAANEAGILILCEMGLDPGIDHMSAMQLIHRIQAEDGKILCFKSYTGGLVAKESLDNPWGYKVTWNPRNVVMAGNATAKYITEGKYKYVPYNRIFLHTETIRVNDEIFEGYPNRDSLSYREPYGLSDIPTMIRGTLRYPGFCKAWNAFVKLGWTDESYRIEASSSLTYKELVEAFLPGKNSNIREQLALLIGEPENSEVINKLEWLGIFSDDKIPIENATPAEILQDLIERKWLLHENDKDMIVMQHQFVYLKEGSQFKVLSSLMLEGQDQVHTAMAQTVGLPLAIAAKLILNNHIQVKGVHIPVIPEIYNPAMAELQKMGIVFQEKETEING